MKPLLETIDRVPAWLRWIVFLPLGVWAASSCDHFVDASMGLTAADRAPNVAGMDVRIYASKILSGMAFTLLPAILSPRPRGVAICGLVFWTLLGLMPVAYRIWIGYVFSEVVVAVVAMAADVLGSALGLYAVMWLVRQRSGYLELEATSHVASDGRPTSA